MQIYDPMNRVQFASMILVFVPLQRERKRESASFKSLYKLNTPVFLLVALFSTDSIFN